MATSQTTRVIELLKRFNAGEKVCIDELQNDMTWWNDNKNEPMSHRNIQRDIDVIKECFPDNITLIRGAKGEKGCYMAMTSGLVDSFINKDSIALIAQTFNIAQRSNILKTLDINDDHRRILERQIDKTKDCYEFISKPYESKKGDETLFKDVEKAINYKRYITVEYKGNNGVQTFYLKPYKIVFINENFYLASENTNEDFQFTMLRMSQISKVTMGSEQFHTNPDIKDFIKEIQTPFSKYTPQFRSKMIEVIVEVSKTKSKFFSLKNHLPSQKILETKEDGSMIVSFKVTQELEVDALIKSWIPHMKVISPLSLKTKIENELKEYLNN